MVAVAIVVVVAAVAAADCAYADEVAGQPRAHQIRSEKQAAIISTTINSSIAIHVVGTSTTTITSASTGG